MKAKRRFKPAYAVIAVPVLLAVAGVLYTAPGRPGRMILIRRSDARFEYETDSGR